VHCLTSTNGLEKLRGATTAAERFPRPARGRRNEKPR
jgi:hypothetical protein